MSMSEKNFKLFLNELTTPVFICKDTGEIVFANKQCKKVLDLPDHLVGKTKVSEILMFDSKNKQKIKKALSSDKSNEVQSFILDRTQPDQLILLNLNIQPVEETEGWESFYLVELDCRDEIYFDSKKIQILGKKTGDIAHAISNPLSIIQFNCETLTLMFDQGIEISSKTLSEKVSVMDQATGRITENLNVLKSISNNLTTLNGDELDELLKVEAPSDQQH